MTKRSAHNLYLTDEAFEELKKLSPNVSQEVDAFIRKRVEELTGRSIGQGVDYELMKARYSELVIRTDKKKERLQKLAGFSDANDLLVRLGVKPDFSNADELIPQFMAAWKGDVEFMHEYVSLVELARDKRVAERCLRTIRTNRLEPKTQDPPREVASAPVGLEPKKEAVVIVQKEGEGSEPSTVAAETERDRDQPGLTDRFVDDEADVDNADEGETLVDDIANEDEDEDEDDEEEEEPENKGEYKEEVE